MVELQLETYTPETISAHTKIRQDFFVHLPYIVHIVYFLFFDICFTVYQFTVDSYLRFTFRSVFLKNNTLFSLFREKLNADLKTCQAEKQSVQLKLSSFEILGKEFEALAEEYCKLRKEIEMKNWALKEFTQYSNKQS